MGIIPSIVATVIQHVQAADHERRIAKAADWAENDMKPSGNGLRGAEAAAYGRAVVERARMTEPFDVWWHLESTEGHQWIVARVPQIENKVTQAETFDDLKVAVKELVATSLEGLEPADVAVGEFTEEAEADFLEAIDS